MQTTGKYNEIINPDPENKVTDSLKSQQQTFSGNKIPDRSVLEAELKAIFNMVNEKEDEPNTNSLN